MNDLDQVASLASWMIKQSLGKVNSYLHIYFSWLIQLKTLCLMFFCKFLSARSLLKSKLFLFPVMFWMNLLYLICTVMWINQNCKTGKNGSTRSIYANFKSQAKVKTVVVSTYTTYNGSCLLDEKCLFSRSYWLFTKGSEGSYIPHWLYYFFIF